MTDPWSGEAMTVGYARSGHTQEFPVVPPPQRRSRTPIIIAVGVVVAILAGVGAYVAASAWYGWSITEPEEVLPADTALVARLDLSPGLGQRLAMGRIAQKFPHDGDGRDIADQLKRGFLGLDGETFDRDIRPWLGDRLAAAAWSVDGTSAGTCTLAALASRNDGTARESLHRVQEREGAAAVGYALRSGYAVVARCDGRTDSQAAATAAVASAAAQSLAALPAFRQAVSELAGRPAALAWADVAVTRRIGADALAGITLPEAAQLGQLVAGLEAADHGLDLRFRLGGAGAPQATVDVLPRLGALPANSAIGICTDLAASTVVTQLGQTVSELLTGGPFATLGTGLATSLGSVLTVAVAVSGTDPTFRMVADTGSVEKATALAFAYGLPGLLTGLTVDVNGGTMTATSRGYHAGEGRLDASATYQAAMAPYGGRPAIAGFIDVAQLRPILRLTAAQAANLQPIQAIGIVAGNEAATLTGQVRVLIP